MDAAAAHNDQLYTVAVLPMLPLGAPQGVLLVRDLHPATTLADLRGRIISRLHSTTPAEPNTNHAVYLYRADLRLDMFADQSSWRFLSTMPLSQLFERIDRAPFNGLYNAPLSSWLEQAPDLTTPHEPPRVVHVVVEIIENVPRTQDIPFPRSDPHRQRLEDADPGMFDQLIKFLSTPPEPVGPTKTHAKRTATRGTTASSTPQPTLAPRAPFFLNDVPAIAQLTLPENKMLVRPIFMKLLDEILRELPHEKRVVFVTATSGAGKTAFLWCVLHALCRRGRTRGGECFAPPMDIVLDVPGLFALIDTAGRVFTGPRDQCFHAELMKKETLYLADLTSGDYHRLKELVSVHTASRLLVGLPRNCAQFPMQTPNRCVVKLLPPWAACELELCRRACFPSLSKELLVARTKLWGPQPLWTLARCPDDGVGEQQLPNMANNLEWVARISGIVGNNCIWERDDHTRAPLSQDTMKLQDAASQLLVLRPITGKRPAWRCHQWQVRWGSSVVREVVLLRVLAVQNAPNASTIIEPNDFSSGLTRLLEWEKSDAGEKYLDFGKKRYWEREP